MDCLLAGGATSGHRDLRARFQEWERSTRRGSFIGAAVAVSSHVRNPTSLCERTSIPLQYVLRSCPRWQLLKRDRHHCCSREFLAGKRRLEGRRNSERLTSCFRAPESRRPATALGGIRVRTLLHATSECVVRKVPRCRRQSIYIYVYYNKRQEFRNSSLNINTNVVYLFCHFRYVRDSLSLCSPHAEANCATRLMHLK